ncbi:MAG: hypothetical protein ABI266_03680 [Ginsengibacter sp.]
MQKNKLFILSFLVLMGFACKNKVEDSSEVVQPITNIEKSPAVFPVTEFIKGQLHELEGIPITPLKKITLNHKTDSLWVKKENIRDFAKPFLFPLIDSTSMQAYFNSHSFLDQTIDAITLTYDANEKLPGTVDLTHFNVYINPLSGEVKRIYLVKKPSADSTIQLTWIADKWCSIVTIVQVPGGKVNIKEEKLIWKFN